MLDECVTTKERGPLERKLLANYTAVLKQLTEERDRLEAAIKAIEGISKNGGGLRGATGKRVGRRRMSAAGRARIAAAQRKRWARQRGTKTAALGGKHGGKARQMSATGRAKIAAAQRARWAKKKADASKSA